MTFLSAPVLDVGIGVMTTVLPAISPPVFLRFAPPADDLMDRARRVYLRAASSTLRLCVAGWCDGAGALVMREPSDLAALSPELHELGRGIHVLGDSEVARSYLDVMTSRTEAGDQPAPNPEKET